MPVNFDKKLILIHIPKTSGMILQDKLKMRHGMLTSGNNCKNGRTKQHYTLELILEVLKENNLNYKDFNFFTIIRNPYDRFISVYNQYPGNNDFCEMINKKNKEEFADYLIERINNEGYDFFNYGSYHQFQPMWMYIENNQNINLNIIDLNSNNYIEFLKKYDIDTTKIRINRYIISDNLRNKIDIIYKKDFDLFKK